MKTNWQKFVAMAQVDLKVAEFEADTNEQALIHLTDARDYIINAIKLLESEDDDG